MYFPPLQPLKKHDCNVSGDVRIDPSAAIAPGVLLHADPESQIIIAAGVCIGMGTIVHASKGTVALEYGASLGAGVLVVGKGKIGANACVGSMTTMIDSDVEQRQVVAPGSLLGDPSRKPSKEEISKEEISKEEISKEEKYVVTAVAQYTASAGTVEPAESALTAETKVKEEPEANTPAVQASINSAVARNASANTPFSPINDSTGSRTQSEPIPPAPAGSESSSDTPSATDLEQTASSEEASPQAIVYGQEQLDELIGTLFPHNKSWRQQLQNGD